MTSANIVQQVLDFYAGDATRWTQRHMARDASGAYATPRAADAVCWCLSGACERLSLSSNEFARALGFKISGPVAAMLAWNDTADRTFADVEARLRAELEQQP